MKDEQKTKAQLIAELQVLRKQLEPSGDLLAKPPYQLAKFMHLITENTAVNIAFTTFDLKANYVYVNQSVKATLGYEPEEIIGKSFFEFIHPDDKKALLPLLKTYLQKKLKKLFTGKESEITEIIEFRFKAKDGRWHFMRSTINVADNYLLAITNDISAQKEIDMRLQEAAAKWETTFNAMSDSVSIIDTDGHLIQYNEATLKMFDISKLEIQAKHCWELVHKTSEPIEDCPIVRMKKSKKAESMVFQDDERWLEVAVDPVFDSNKNIIGAVHIVSDISSRKQVEKALLKSENKYRTLFEQSADALLIIKDGVFVDCNPATVKMLGYRNKEMFLDTHPSELSPEHQPDGKPSFKKANEMIAIALKKGSHRFEWYHKKHSGEVFPVEVLLTTISLDEENFIHVVWRDITERKQVEKALRESEQKNRILIDMAPDSFFQGDMDGNLIRVNAKACELTGYTEEELLTFNISELFNIKSLSEKPLRYDLLDTGSVLTTERQMQRKDGSAVYIEMNSRLMPDGTYQSFIRDISDRIRFQERLKEREALFRNLFEKNQAVMILIEPENGEIIDVNKAACSYYGWSREEMLTKNIKQINTLSDSEVQEEMKRALNHQQNYFEFKHRLADGSIRNVEVYSGAVKIYQRKLLYSLVFDITERKQAEKRLEESENKLRLIVEGTPNLFFYMQDKNGDLSYISPSVEKITGRSVEEWKKRKDWFLTDNPFNDLVKDATRKHLNGETTDGPIIAEIEHADNYPILLEIYENIVFEDGTVQGLQGVAHDITQRYKAEEALKKSEKSFRLLFESSPLGIYFATPEGKILDGNRAMLDILGSPSLEATKQINVLTFPPLVKNGFAASFKKCVREKRTHLFEVSYTSKWGKKILLSSYIVPLTDAQGKVEKVYTLMQDITERKQAEERIKESEERFRMAFYTSPDAITISSVTNGKYLDVNDGFTNITGYAKEEALGKTVSDLDIWHENKERIRFVKELKKNKVVHNLEVRFHIKSGGIVFGLLSATLIQLNREKVILSIVRDITDRKLAEKQLYESEERYRNLVEQMTDGVYRSTEDGRFLDVNPAMVRILGYDSKEELMNVDIKKKLYFKDSERKEIVQSLKISGDQKIETFRLRHKDGHEIWVEDHGRLVCDEQGNILYHEGVMRDITERKEAQERIARLAEFNKNIVSSAPVGIITVNNKKKVTSANDTFLKMMGSPGLEETLKIGIKLPIIANENIRSFFQNAMTKGQSFEIKHLPYTSYWGKELVVDLKGVPQKTESGLIYGVIIVVNDVTKSVQADEDRKKLEVQLRRAQKLETIGTLAGGIAHDFNNILAPIMGFTELALLKVDEATSLARDLNQVLKGAHRAKELVEQILLFSKQSEKEHQPIALQPLIDEALKLLRPSIPSTVEIIKNISPSCAKVRADATQIHQIIVNLCTNAWQAMEEGGALTIQLEQTKVDPQMSKMHPNLTEGDFVRLSIIDTGAGMDEATMDRIFEPFFTTKAVNKGTGLGLSVVHGIVRNHRGDILVYSEPGKGSAFHIYLPALQADDDAITQRPQTVMGGAESVMIVDDEPVIAEMVKTMLENFGYQAHIYKTAMEAVEAFEGQPQQFDLLITDLTMPQMTGLDLADQLHETSPKFPVIIMTGFGDNLTKPTLKRYGIRQVIGKPVIVKELATAVRKVLDKNG